MTTTFHSMKPHVTGDLTKIDLVMLLSSTDPRQHHGHFAIRALAHECLTLLEEVKDAQAVRVKDGEIICVLVNEEEAHS